MTKRDNPHPLTIYRQQAGLTQRQLAEQIGVHKWTITRLEVGEYTPSAALCVRLEQQTGVPRAVFRPDLFGPIHEAAE